MGSIPIQTSKNYNMSRNSRYAREGSVVYKAPCGKSILESNGGDELKEHIENCEDCRDEAKKYNTGSERSGAI